MAFSSDDRVVLTHAYEGLPPGSLGTVRSSTDASTIVDFDARPSQSSFVPTRWLRLAGARAREAKTVSFSQERGAKMFPGDSGELLWFAPTAVAPGVGTDASFVAVTAVPNLLTLLLQGAEVALRGGTTSGCWIGSAEFPVIGGPATLRVDARGFAEQTAGSKTTILIVIGAVFKSIAFDDARSGEFTETFEATIGDEPHQTITIILLAERTAASSDLLVSLDSLDIVRV